MGCDIHAYMEFKIDGEWVLLGQLVAHRNYNLFGRLTKGHSRSRDDEEGMFDQAEELWSDATEELQDIWKGWGSDGHSLTLIETHEDLQMFCDAYDRPEEDWEDSIQKMSGFVQEWEEIAMKLIYSGTAEEVRIALWYDN